MSWVTEAMTPRVLYWNPGVDSYVIIYIWMLVRMYKSAYAGAKYGCPTYMITLYSTIIMMRCVYKGTNLTSCSKLEDSYQALDLHQCEYRVREGWRFPFRTHPTNRWGPRFHNDLWTTIDEMRRWTNLIWELLTRSIKTSIGRAVAHDDIFPTIIRRGDPSVTQALDSEVVNGDAYLHFVLRVNIQLVFTWQRRNL